MMKKKYFDIEDDFKLCPKAWCYVELSKRGPGKTYSTLRHEISSKKKFLFLKRTIEDIKMLCANGAAKGVRFDVSPFVPLNRDFGWDIKPALIIKGIAGFYHTDDEEKPYGAPLGYCAALSAEKDIKGFDMSDVDDFVFDEFIAKKGERINRHEGEQLLDLYMTIRRDRTLRGRPDLRLILLANTVNVNNPVMQTLDIVDTVAEMDVTGREYCFLEERGIFIHIINNEFAAEEEKSGIEKAMAGTAWGDMAFGGHFSFDDFTSVQHKRLKGYRPLCSYTYKKKDVYIYEKDGFYYACRAKCNSPAHYNLNRENEQKKFWNDYVSYLREECIEDKFTFSEFSMYDLIVNYRKIFFNA